MRIAKPILMVSTPLGVAGGLYEAYRLAGGMVLVAAAMIALLSVAAGSVILTVRREAAAERARGQVPGGPAVKTQEGTWTATSR